MADWSLLPCDILGEIALKLDAIDDFIYFSTVCHSWNHASSLVKGERNAGKTMPWLLLAENTHENPNHLRKIVNLSNNNKCYQLSIPETFGARCWGSCCGWIVLLTRDHQVKLFNPLTKDEIINFPSTLNLPIRPFSPTITEDRHWFWRHFVHRFEVLKTNNNSLIIAAIYGEMDTLAIARPGDQDWVVIDDMVQNVVRCGSLVYIVCVTGRTRYWDIEEAISCDLEEVKVMEYLPTNRTEVWGYDKVFLVNNSGGDLLMVVRSKVDFDDGTEEEDDLDFVAYRTVKFEVFRVDSKSNKWVKLKDYFGSFAIFVGCNSAICIPTSVANKTLRSNCIYFTDDDKMSWNSVPGFGGYDMGVYHFKTGDITKFYQGDHIDIRSSFCPPFFFVPDY